MPIRVFHSADHRLLDDLVRRLLAGHGALDRHGVPYRWVDVDRTPGAEHIVMRINRGFRSVPTLVFSDGSTLTEPTSRTLADKLGIDANARLSS